MYEDPTDAGIPARRVPRARSSVQEKTSPARVQKPKNEYGALLVCVEWTCHFIPGLSQHVGEAAGPGAPTMIGTVAYRPVHASDTYRSTQVHALMKDASILAC